jgi:hypothetical protein
VKVIDKAATVFSAFGALACVRLERDIVIVVET